MALDPPLPTGSGCSKEMRGFCHPYIFDLLVPPVFATKYAGNDRKKEK